MDIILTIIILLLFNTFFIRALIDNNKSVSEKYPWLLFMVHIIISIAYYTYVYNSKSDSRAYYRVSHDSDEWLFFLKSGTQFINFLAWPFTRLIGLSYPASMFLFSYFGYIGVLLFYLTTKENIKLNYVWQRLTPVELVFLLPNLHFWTASLGKGSCIVLALAIFSFGLSRFNKRITFIIIGSVLVFFIRPHILFIIAIGVALGLFFTSTGIKLYLRWIIFCITMVVLILISGSVKEFAHLDSIDILSSSSLNHRASELSKASSGIDIQNYNFFMKLFTFCFRPLFFDGGGVIGFIASIENMLYIIMFVAILSSALKFWKNWNGFFKISLFVFFCGAFFLGQVTGNLGIAMRQKAQIMPFFFIIYCKALSYYQNSKRGIPLKAPENQL